MHVAPIWCDAQRGAFWRFSAPTAWLAEESPRTRVIAPDLGSHPAVSALASVPPLAWRTRCSSEKALCMHVLCGMTVLSVVHYSYRAPCKLQDPSVRGRRLERLLLERGIPHEQ